MTYTKDNYYEGLGTYIGIRTTYSYTGKVVIEHLFREGTYDRNGAANLTRIKIK